MLSSEKAPTGVLAMVIDIVGAYTSHNYVSPAELPGIVASVSCTMHGIASGLLPRPSPAVAIEDSVQHDYIVCLEDGVRMKMLKRYLKRNYGLSPDEYRRRWELSPDYPLVCPEYRARRSALARQNGFGTWIRTPGKK